MLLLTFQVVAETKLYVKSVSFVENLDRKSIIHILVGDPVRYRWIPLIKYASEAHDTQINQNSESKNRTGCTINSGVAIVSLIVQVNRLAVEVILAEAITLAGVSFTGSMDRMT